MSTRTITIDLDTGEWVTRIGITGEEGIRVAASVLPGITETELDRFYSRQLSADHVDEFTALVRVIDDNTDQATLSNYGDVSFTNDLEELASTILESGYGRERSRPILPGDMVGHREKKELDYREVVSVGRDWLTLDILGTETDRLPLDNYEIQIMRQGVL